MSAEKSHPFVEIHQLPVARVNTAREDFALEDNERMLVELPGGANPRPQQRAKVIIFTAEATERAMFGGDNVVIHREELFRRANPEE
jgi:hypothetical protein